MNEPINPLFPHFIEFSTGRMDTEFYNLYRYEFATLAELNAFTEGLMISKDYTELQIIKGSWEASA